MNSKIKVVVSSLFLAFASASATHAADDGTIVVAPPVSPDTAPSGKPHDGKRAQGALEERLQQLDQKLQLTSEQKQKIKDIWSSEAAGAKAAEGKDRRAALMAAHDKVRGVLTPQQQTKFDAMGMERPSRKGKAKKAQ